MPSWQIYPTNLLMRLTVRNMLSAQTDYAYARQQITRQERLMRRMKTDFERRPVMLDGIPAEWIITPGADPQRLLLYYHGGGFTLHSPGIHSRMLARICKVLGATGLMVDYRLAPEHPFPAAFDDALASYRWALGAGYDPAQIILGGDSAGGTLTFGTLVQARDQGLPLPACALLLSPGLGTIVDNAVTAEKIKSDVMLSPGAIQGFTQALLPTPELSAAFDALLKSNYAGLPPLLFQAGSAEMLEIDSIQGAERAQAAGVDAKLTIYAGMPHVFQLFGWLPETKQALIEMAEFVGAYLD